MTLQPRRYFFHLGGGPMFDSFAIASSLSRRQRAPAPTANDRFAIRARFNPASPINRHNFGRRLDTIGPCSFNVRSSGVPVALTGQEGIRCVAPLRRQDNSGAAPATVGGEPFSHVPLGLAVQDLGRLRRVTTREPGNLPEPVILPAHGVRVRGGLPPWWQIGLSHGWSLPCMLSSK